MAKVMTRRHAKIPRSYLETVGAIVFYWATIEHELVDLIGTALGIGKKERRILMAKMDPKAKIAMLKVIGSKYVKKRNLTTNLNNLVKALSPLYDVRNMFAHGAWVYPEGKPFAYELLVIDSGEAAYLPKRMEMTDTGRRSVVDHFANALAATRAITQEIGATKPNDGKSSVTSEAETAAPLVVPDNVANGGE